MTDLRIDKLTIEYSQGGYTVRPINELDATVEDGELVVLLGPSGSGKTTLLSCMAALLRPASGEIHVGDVNVTALEGEALGEYRRHGVGVIFQAFNLIPSLTARENVAAPMRLAGSHRGKANARAEELLERVGLEDRMQHRPGEMSGGQQQRVAIARALVHEPPLILADEPTAHLDYVQVEEVLLMIRRLAQPGRVVIVATHDDRFTPLADRVIELVPPRSGDEPELRRVELQPGQRLYAEGDPAELVWVVEEGLVEVYRRRGGERNTLGRFGAGEFFGEVGPLFNMPRVASARALEPTKLTGYGPTAFRHWLSMHRGKPQRRDSSMSMPVIDVSEFLAEGDEFGAE